jgi:putative two-component system response regulator
MHKILIVDDDANFLFGASRMLEKASFEVISASEGWLGVIKALNEQPDLIILDVNMPGMNGFQVKQALDNNQGTRNIPTVFLTAVDDKKHTLSGLGVAHDYLIKPLDADILIARLNAILRRSQNDSMSLVASSEKLSYSVDHFQKFEDAIAIHNYGAAGHTVRVALWFVVLARRLGVDGELLQYAQKGAMLHDIGNNAISDNTLIKTGTLTNEECILIRENPENAVEILKSIPSLRFSLDIPYCHRERWDGKGYPKGVRGEEIPLVVRIFSLVHVYDVLHTKRPYKASLNKKQILEVIKSESEKQFDPQIVNYFITNFQSLLEEVTNESITNNSGN